VKVIDESISDTLDKLSVYLEYLNHQMRLKAMISWWCVQTQSYEGFWDNQFENRWDKEVPKLEAHYLSANIKSWTFEEFISPQKEIFYWPDRVVEFVPMDEWIKNRR